MKKIVFGSMTLAMASLFMACGDQTANNKPSNIAAANTNTATPAPNPAAIEGDIKKLVNDYAASVAKNDVATLDRMWADNFVFVSNDGSMQTKAERLDSMRSGQTKYETLTYDDVDVHVNPQGDSAVVVAKATVKGTSMGKPINGVNRVTQLWSQTKDGWKMSSLQATNMTAKPEDKTKMAANINMAANTPKNPANTKANANAKADTTAADESATPKKATNKK